MKNILEFLQTVAEGSGLINEHYLRAEAGELLREYKSQPVKEVDYEGILKYKQNSTNRILHFPVKRSNQLAGAYIHVSATTEAMKEAVSQSQQEIVLPEIHTLHKSYRGFIEELKQLNPNVKFKTG